MPKILKAKAVTSLRTFIVWTLRKASYRWAPRGSSLSLARVARNEYRCASCQLIYGRKGVKVDHIIPVVDPASGWVSYDEFIQRMFCDARGFQVLCDKCHDEKTQAENKLRLETRKLLKESGHTNV